MFKKLFFFSALGGFLYFIFFVGNPPKPSKAAPTQMQESEFTLYLSIHNPIREKASNMDSEYVDNILLSKRLIVPLARVRMGRVMDVYYAPGYHGHINATSTYEYDSHNQVDSSYDITLEKPSYYGRISKSKRILSSDSVSLNCRISDDGLSRSYGSLDCYSIETRSRGSFDSKMYYGALSLPSSFEATRDDVYILGRGNDTFVMENIIKYGNPYLDHRSFWEGVNDATSQLPRLKNFFKSISMSVNRQGYEKTFSQF